MQSLAGRLGVLVAAILVAAGMAAAAVYLATLADTSVADELLPAGVYDSIEEARRATGFKIPHAREPDGWRLTSIEVSGPEYGIIGEGDKAEIGNLRFASLTYRREVGEREAWVSAYPANGDAVKPIQGAGLAERRTIAGHDAQFQLNHLDGTTAATVFVQWLDNGLLVTAHAVLITPIEVSGRVVEPGLTLEQFLALLNAFD